MYKEEFLKMFNQCLEDRDIEIYCEHEKVNSYSDEWTTTKVTVTVRVNDEEVFHHVYNGN